jgi:septum formation protein
MFARLLPSCCMLTLIRPLVLGSNSPRRRQILHDAGFEFTVRALDTDETFPPDLPSDQVPGYLARRKAEAFGDEARTHLILTADTVVRINGEILNKPTDPADAHRMLRTLSGHWHHVTTGVCLRDGDTYELFADTAAVYFRDLTDAEIEYYLRACRPFDKAGAYGVQDFIGMVGIERLEGSYFTVMGLPIHRVYERLAPYVRFRV